MEYKYKIIGIDEANCRITIASNNRSYMEEPNSFANLVKMVQHDVDGTVEKVGEMQFRIADDKLNLIYMWDGLFGISIAYPENVKKEEVLEFLEKYMSDF